MYVKVRDIHMFIVREMSEASKWEPFLAEELTETQAVWAREAKGASDCMLRLQHYLKGHAFESLEQLEAESVHERRVPIKVVSTSFYGNGS